MGRYKKVIFVEGEVSIFLLSRLQEKIVYLHVDADLLSFISSHLSSLSHLLIQFLCSYLVIIFIY